VIARALRGVALLLGAAAALGLGLDRLFPLPLPDARRDGATVVLAADGNPLRAFADRDGVTG
jgi:penicillin-binding protein 1C